MESVSERVFPADERSRIHNALRYILKCSLVFAFYLITLIQNLAMHACIGEFKGIVALISIKGD